MKKFICPHPLVIADPYILIKTNSTSFTTLLSYVDDIILAGNNLSDNTLTKQHLDNCFIIKDLGPLKYVLDIEIAQSI